MINDEPDVPGRLVWVWNAFWVMSNSRQCGMGANPISSEALTAYCQRHQITDLDRVQYLERMIQAMDHVWLEAHSQKSEDSSLPDDSFFKT